MIALRLCISHILTKMFVKDEKIQMAVSNCAETPQRTMIFTIERLKASQRDANAPQFMT